MRRGGPSPEDSPNDYQGQGNHQPAQELTEGGGWGGGVGWPSEHEAIEQVTRRQGRGELESDVVWRQGMGKLGA